jgi:hypothetical protein
VGNGYLNTSPLFLLQIHLNTSLNYKLWPV